ncbi:MAG TPA: hypothetical protein VM529_22945, partial [Gemmata sp.]|nr:hypothetical protein [Gemmata sp.]
MRPIDLDRNATTPLLPAAWDAMRAAPAGNPSSAHSAGRRDALAGVLQRLPRAAAGGVRRRRVPGRRGAHRVPRRGEEGRRRVAV